MLASAAFDRPAGYDHRLADLERPIDRGTEPAEQGEPGAVLEPEIAGAIQRRPDELRSHLARVVAQARIRDPAGRDLPRTSVVDAAGKDAQPVPDPALRPADEAAGKDVMSKAGEAAFGL